MNYKINSLSYVFEFRKIKYQCPHATRSSIFSQDHPVVFPRMVYFIEMMYKTPTDRVSPASNLCTLATQIVQTKRCKCTNNNIKNECGSRAVYTFFLLCQYAIQYQSLKRHVNDGMIHVQSRLEFKVIFIFNWFPAASPHYPTSDTTAVHGVGRLNLNCN